MNLLMCCTPINKENIYNKELRFPYLAGEFFWKIYPQADIYIGTTPDAVIPEYLKNKFKFIAFPFEKYPFAIARQLFYKRFCESDYFTEDTILAGCDVIFPRKIDFSYEENPITMTYRYHPTMPYCSDFVLLNQKFKEECVDFFSKIIFYMKWMPKEIQSGWADQLAIARTIGYLKDDDFDGANKFSKNIENIKLVPGDDYLYTPNDVFPSTKINFTGSIIKNTSTVEDYEKLLFNKVGIHFKGNRKKDFILISYLAYLKKIIDCNNSSEFMSIEKLFEEPIMAYGKSI